MIYLTLFAKSDKTRLFEIAFTFPRLKLQKLAVMETFLISILIWWLLEVLWQKYSGLWGFLLHWLGLIGHKKNSEKKRFYQNRVGTNQLCCNGWLKYFMRFWKKCSGGYWNILITKRNISSGSLKYFGIFSHLHQRRRCIYVNFGWKPLLSTFQKQGLCFFSSCAGNQDW